MARPSKLSQEQCDRIRMLKNEEGISAPKLAKRFKISESSLYKILNGSYVVGAAGTGALPPVVEAVDQGATPSIFNKARAPMVEQDVASRVIKAADATSRQNPIDEVTLAAAELIVAQARYLQVNKHTR